MKNVTKRIMSVIITTVIMASTTTSVSAESLWSNSSNENVVYNSIRAEVDNYQFSDNIVDEIIYSYISESVFIQEYKEDFKSAIETVDNAIRIQSRIATEILNEEVNLTALGNNNTLFYCTVDTTIEQEQPTWCGVGSTLMALTGIETFSSTTLVSGYTRPTQTVIANNVIPPNENTAFVGYIVQYLNSLLKSSKYTYKMVSSTTTSAQIQSYIKSSLAANRPVIFRSYPYNNSLSYYNGSGIDYDEAHYIVVYRYDSSNNTFSIADCTYVDGYQGSHHNITLNEIYNCLQRPNSSCLEGYIIHG